MSWTTPRSWVAGEVLTAALLNTHVRDNENYLYSSLLPPGVIFGYGAATAPTGYLLCDGTAVSRSTYSGLFAVISTTWGAGDASTTFNVPDHRGRTGIGQGTGSGLTARTLAATAGEETHLLSTPEMPSHTHVLYMPSGDGGFSQIDDAGSGNGVKGSAMAGAALIDATGGGGTHNNMQPSIVKAYIIKF